MADEEFTPQRFAVLCRDFLERFNEALPGQSDELHQLLTAHMGVDSQGLPSVSEKLDPTDHPNLQLALDAMVAEPGSQVIGLPGELLNFGRFSLASLAGGRFHGPAAPAPVQYVNVAVDVDRTLPCVRLGLFLVRLDDVPLVVLAGLVEGRGPRASLTVEVMAAERTTAEALLARLHQQMDERNVYRGKVLSFSYSEYGEFGIT